MLHTRSIVTVAVAAALLLPAAAFADRDRRHRRHHGHEHHHHASCGHVDYRNRPLPPPPPGSSTAHGRYELQTVQRWVDGYWAEQWVPEQCVTRGRHHKRVKCTPGYYTRQWVPGRYETVQEWVWVPYHRHGAHFSWTVRVN